MKKKGFILPVVLIIFSVIIMVSVSVYYRFISSYNMKNSQEVSLKNKLYEYSIEEILNTNKVHDYINANLYKKESFSKRVEITDLIDISLLSEDFYKKLSDYTFNLYHISTNKDSIFPAKHGNNSKFNGDIQLYEVVLTITNKTTKHTYEYRFKDCDRIENHLFDLQLKGYINGNRFYNFNNFYFKIDEKNNYSNLYSRIFSDENGTVIFGNYRVFDFEKKLYYIENDVYLSLVEKYIKDNYKLKEKNDRNDDLEDFDISAELSIYEKKSIYDIENLFEEYGIEKKYVMDFIKNSLVLNSDIINSKDILSVDINDFIVIDVKNMKEIYLNLKAEGDIEAIDLHNFTTVKGIFLNNSNEDIYDINLKGILFSKVTPNSKYSFYPTITGRMSKLVKLSENYFIERVDFRDIE